jgi:perosamine synthetase
VVAVDYAGQPCDYEALYAIAERHGLALVSDACHAIGGSYRGRPVGTLADLNTFSFHPVKHITTGEGGAITTHSAELAQRMRIFRNHGITSDHRQRAQAGDFFYEMVDLGYNYRLTDLQCALGLSQLHKLQTFIRQRQTLAAHYTAAFADMPGIQPLTVQAEVVHAYHLYVIQCNLDSLRASRNEILAALRAEGIGVNVHYIPIHLHPFYRQRFHTGPGLCPIAEAAYQRLITLPLFAHMSMTDANDVIAAVDKVLHHYSK